MVAHMEMTSIDAQDYAYSQAALATDFGRLMFISGQVPQTRDGRAPDNFDEQCRVAWRNVLALLEKAGMTTPNLVKVTVFLADRKYREANARIRHEILGDHAPALTVIIVGIYDPAWLVEVEAVAAS
jgi:2-iminobutanoate/2-iminopropanoate deaminase